MWEQKERGGCVFALHHPQQMTFPKKAQKTLSLPAPLAPQRAAWRIAAVLGSYKLSSRPGLDQGDGRVAHAGSHLCIGKWGALLLCHFSSAFGHPRWGPLSPQQNSRVGRACFPGTSACLKRTCRVSKMHSQSEQFAKDGITGHDN